jgi:hypothetical protein
MDRFVRVLIKICIASITLGVIFAATDLLGLWVVCAFIFLFAAATLAVAFPIALFKNRSEGSNFVAESRSSYDGSSVVETVLKKSLIGVTSGIVSAIILSLLGVKEGGSIVVGSLITITVVIATSAAPET